MKKWLIEKTIIEKCLDCHDKAWVISEKCFCCYKKDLRNIKDENTIPKWCPLKDYKEVKNDVESKTKILKGNKNI